MSRKKLASLTVAIMIGAALIAAPAQARGGGGGPHGGFGGGPHGGFGGGPHGGFGGWGGGGAFRSAGVRPGFVGRPGFGPGRRFGFFRGRRFGPFFGGFYGAAYATCWTWVPTAFGWQQVWACGSPYGYGYGYGF